MTLLKKLSLILICLSLIVLSTFVITSCGSENYEDGILYNGTAVIGADKEAEELTVKDGTTSIAAGAFSDCKKLTSLTIPDSVTEIAGGAFDGCDALIKTEGGVNYVDGWAVGADRNATDISVKDGTRGIVREAFVGLTSLKTVTVPASVKHIGARAFFRCSAIEKITLPFIGKSISSKTGMHFGYIFGAFNREQNSEYVPESLKEVNVTSCTEIADYAFSGCNKISVITLPDSLKSIGANAFSGCTALGEIIIPDSVTDIGEKAFYKCSALTTVKLPENSAFTSIPEYTFAYCSSITKMTIPASVKEIGACAVARCLNLEELKFKGESIDRIGQQAFDGCKYISEVNLTVKTLGKAAFQNCIGLTDVTLGDGTVEIESYAFNGCSGIVNFSMPESVTKIGEYSFYACYSMTSITLGKSIKAIESYTFQNCINLKEFVIPSSVTSVGEDAFSGCNALVERVDGISYVDGWIVDIQPSVTSIEIGDGVRGFAVGAFSDAINLAEIRLFVNAEKWQIIEATIPTSIRQEINVISNTDKDNQ